MVHGHCRHHLGYAAYPTPVTGAVAIAPIKDLLIIQPDSFPYSMGRNVIHQRLKLMTFEEGKDFGKGMERIQHHAAAVVRRLAGRSRCPPGPPQGLGAWWVPRDRESGPRGRSGLSRPVWTRLARLPVPRAAGPLPAAALQGQRPKT